MRVEVLARNVVALVPDVSGKTLQRRTIVPGAPATKVMPAPARALLAALREKGVEVKLGALAPDFWKGFDLVVVSPGVPLAKPELKAAAAAGAPLVGEVELAWRCLPEGAGPVLGVTGTVRRSGRYSLRWPGWCAFWRPLKRLGLLADEPVEGLDCTITPHQFMVKLLEPRLQYQENERDVVAMYNVFAGVKDGRPKSLKNSLVIERDLKSGLYGMSLGVGFPASIVAQMIALGQITQKGVLNPALDVPYAPFMAALKQRGIVVKEEVE